MQSPPESLRPRLLGILLRFAIAYVVLTIAFAVVGSVYASAVIPLLARTIDAMASDLAVQSLVDANDKLTLVARIVMTRAGSGTLSAANAELSIPTMTLYVSPILVLSLLFAWPMRTGGAKLVAFLLAIPLTIMVTVADTRSALLTALAQQLANDPSWRPPFTSFFFESGGTQLLSLFATYLAVRGGHALSSLASGPIEPATEPAIERKAPVKETRRDAPEPRAERKRARKRRAG